MFSKLDLGSGTWNQSVLSKGCPMVNGFKKKKKKD